MHFFGSKTTIAQSTDSPGNIDRPFTSQQPIKTRIKFPFTVPQSRSGIGLRPSGSAAAKTTTFAIDYSYPESKDVILPGIVIGSYRTDLNIIKIHEAIRDIFSYYRYNYLNLKDEIRNLLALAEVLSKQTTPLEAIARRRQAENIEKLINKYSEKAWYDYIDASKDLLDKYLTITSYGKSKSFVFGCEATPMEKESDEKINLRLDIIENYKRIVENLIEINIVFIPQPRLGCFECGQKIDEMEVNEEQGCYYCGCGSLFDQVYSTEAPYQDPDRIEVSSRSAYEDKTNFIRRLNAYQGIQERDIPQELLDILDTYFQENCGIAPAESIRQLEPDEYGHRGKETSVRLLEDGLRKTNNTQYYKDMDLIVHRLWGWKLPDISHLVPIILDDYSRTQEIYRQIKPNGSSINVNLRLYWHLRAAGYNCRLEDFKIPSSSDSLKNQSELFKKMCEKTKVKFFHII